MYVVVVHITVHTDMVDVFLPTIMENARTSLRQEPACLRFDVCMQEGKPDRVMLYEIYDDRAGFEAHLASAHYAEFDETSRPMIAEKSVVCYQLVDNDPRKAAPTV